MSQKCALGLKIWFLIKEHIYWTYLDTWKEINEKACDILFSNPKLAIMDISEIL